MSEQTEKGTAVNVESAVAADKGAQGAQPSAKKRKRWPIVVGVVAVVLVVAGVGFWTWHETPSFCGAICHTPMDEYLTTYDQQPDTAGVDKWGNQVSNTSALLSVSHQYNGAKATCLSCHAATLSEQVSEGTNWISGNYYYPLYERDGTNLTAARGAQSDEFCLNSSCHNISRSDLIEATSDNLRNPHVSQHSEFQCTDCHKAHRASVNACSECHNDAPKPDGWITVAQEHQLEEDYS